MKKGAFDLEDLSEQLQQLQKLGGMSGMMGMLPGMGKIKKQLDGVDLDNGVLKRQMAIISSMTTSEKRNPKVMNASRKKRVAAGSGTKVEEINRLLKMHLQMSDMMKQMGRGKGMFGKMFGGKGVPDAAELEKMQAELAAMDPNALPPELREHGGWRRLPELPKPAPGLPGSAASFREWAACPVLAVFLGLGGLPFRGFPPSPGKKR